MHALSLLFYQIVILSGAEGLFPSKTLRLDSAQRDILIFINCFWTPSSYIKKHTNEIKY